MEQVNLANIQTIIMSTENLFTIAEKLQDVFTGPWNGFTPLFPFINSEGLPEVAPRLPSIGQMKMILKSLNPRKATGVDIISA